MKSGKAVGPDDIPVEVWKCLGEAAVEFLASLFNRVLESERMPEEWRRSVLVPIFKNKGDVQSCSNYRGIKLMSHTMKLWERVVEARLRKVVEICEQQYGFMPRKSTTDAIFALRILMEKYRDGQRELHCVFVDLEKAYDRVPREELWYCMRKSGVAEKYVRVVQDMYERSRTVVRCAVGQTEEFKVEVGLHQGSALSPFLFAMVMDQLSEEVRQESPWTMMFADDIVICSESREQVEENLERWRFALERRGMKVSRSKIECMCVNEREGSGTVRLQGEELKKVQEFKYLGSTISDRTGIRTESGQCTNFIPDRSRPGLTTTAIGAVDLQGAGGNWATVGQRSRGGRRVRRQREKRKGKSVGLRIGTLNVGTMTGKGRELADMMERRKVDILCVQETRWKGSKARSIGAGFKLFYYGVDSKRNGVGVVLKEEFVRNVLGVKRVSDRVMSLKLEIEGVMLNVVSGYAPQVGCELEEKERFWSELDEVMESIPTGERVVIGADFNGHVGEGNTGDEEVMGKFGVKERNLEGQMVVDFAKRMDMGVVNTYFQKREEHRVTYKSGGRSTQVDYILCRRGNLKEISDCKVVVGESVARQHRMVVCRMTLMVCKKKRSEIEKKTKWWKLKKEECCEEFRQKLRQALGGQVVLPDDWETTAEVIRETGRKVLGVSSGRRKEDKETWWWNEEVQDSIQRKRLAKKKWDMDRTEENRQEYKELQRRVKREVSKAKQKAYDELYTRLDTREGEKDLYRLARQRDRDGKDVQQVRVIKDRDGRVLTSEESVQRRWKEYFEELMNEENEREKRVEGVNSVEQKVDKIRKDEVRKALKRMKSGKAVGPDDIPVEVWKCLGEAAVEFLASLFNRVLESERMPEEWRRSVLVPIFKNKGDVQSCSNYRGIKLMSHTMKVCERVVEARLRKVVEICEQQYGFMPRKSTTDAIFALRILMEKYRDGQRELHCVFVDLEKAYDKVPREELWYCMRKSGVAEKYVRVVQDMYERSRTVVRCAVGQTEEFNVEVGLHQGSALSPFLFAIVMDQLSEEVRQESPWTMMFADDIVICSESREQVEENLERWRFALERRGMKVSRSKTEYMCVNEREGSGTVRLQGEEVKKVQEFKYLGSTVQSNGECRKEVKKRVQAGWIGWRKVSGVLCDQKISARIKGKVYRTVVRPAMLYGLETVSLRKRQESELEVAELKMLRFSLGVTRLDRIRNEYIRGTAHVGRLGDKVREARLRWFGHVQRRENENKLGSSVSNCAFVQFCSFALFTEDRKPQYKVVNECCDFIEVDQYLEKIIIFVGKKITFPLLIINILLLTTILLVKGIHYYHFRQSVEVLNAQKINKEMWYLHDDTFYLFWINHSDCKTAYEFCQERRADLATVTANNREWLQSQINRKRLLVKMNDADMPYMTDMINSLWVAFMAQKCFPDGRREKNPLIWMAKVFHNLPGLGPALLAIDNRSRLPYLDYHNFFQDFSMYDIMNDGNYSLVPHPSHLIVPHVSQDRSGENPEHRQIQRTRESSLKRPNKHCKYSLQSLKVEKVPTAAVYRTKEKSEEFLKKQRNREQQQLQPTQRHERKKSTASVEKEARIMAKTKELTEDLRLRNVAAHKSGKGYKTISKCFEVPVATVQSIIKKYKTFCTVKNLRGRGRKPKVTPVLARRIVREVKKEYKDHHQGHPDESGLCWWQHLKADSPTDTAHRWVPRTQTKEDTTSPDKAHKSSLGLCKCSSGQRRRLLVFCFMVR
ncbi:hypothetical protein QTP70_004204 [Hemibagrus guttatus]|uniref:ribonuclease H n=1 Tax=Hemibagrus guttatus TaxID=175788 RepID=A0AAE0PW05_9TELE|nr:hypothetical protein QTP70_004204 [Hemibagrus guttatus]